MKTDFMKAYEELERLSEARMPADEYAKYSAMANDYKNYTIDSPAKYQVYWPNAWYDSDKTGYTNSEIPFRQAVYEILNIINKLPAEKKFGIDIQCKFLDGSNLDIEAFYLYNFAEEYNKPAVLRFNSRSATPAPKFVRDAGQKILDALNK